VKAIALLACAIMPLAHAALRPSFLLNRCAWEATEVLELAIAPGESHFRVVYTIKGDSRPGDIKTIPELVPPVGNHSLLKDLLFEFPDERTYGIAPPIRDVDRLIVFLRPEGRPANGTMLTSAIWLQDEMAYVFEQRMNPQGEDQLVAYSDPSIELEKVIRAALAKLSGGSKEAANALLPFLDDEGLMRVHWQILDTIAATGARDIPLDSVIRRESAYWSATCHQALDEDWVSNYGEEPAFHYFRLVSALKIMKGASSKSDLSVLKELGEIVNHCEHLSQKQELVELTRGLTP
jgi:hypothetical protein